MDEFLLTAITAALYSGFALLAISQTNNWKLVVGKKSTERNSHVYRMVGALLIIAALPVCFWRDGAGFGSLLWVVLSSVSAAAVTLTLTWRPRWLRIFVRVGKCDYFCRKQ